VTLIQTKMLFNIYPSNDDKLSASLELQFITEEKQRDINRVDRLVVEIILVN